MRWSERLGAARPFTWQAFALMAGALVALSPALLATVLPYRIALFTAVISITLGGIALLALACEALIVRGRTFGQAPRAAWGSLVATSCAFPVLFRLVLLQFVPGAPLVLGVERGVTAATFWCLCSVAIAVAVADTRRFRRELELLHSRLAEVKQLEESEQTTLDAVRVSLATSIRDDLAAAFTNASRMRRLLPAELEQVLRPIVRSLASPMPVAVPASRSSVRIRVREVVTRLLESNPFDYRLMPVAVAVSSLFMKSWLLDVPRTLLSTALNALLLAALLWFFHRLAVRFPPRTAAMALLRVMVGFSLCVMLSAGSTAIFSGVGVSAGVVLIAVVEFVALIVVALMRSVPLERARVLAEASASLERAQWLQRRLGQLVWIEQRRLARIVHGDVQGRILATVARLQQADDDPAEVLSELALQCAEVVRRPEQNLPIAEFLRALGQLWVASVRIHIVCSERDTAIIDADPVAKDALAELIREAINNAVKHAQARELWISGGFSRIVDGRFAIFVCEVRNRRARDVAVRSRAGGGSELFDQLTERWGIDTDDSYTRVRFDLPVQLDTRKTKD